MREHLYRIVVLGELGQAAREAFAGLALERSDGHTTLIGTLDQSALYGVLHRIHVLAIELVSITRCDG